MSDPHAASFAVVRAPSGLGLRATGVEGLADALLGHGLAEALGARAATTVAAPPGSGVRDPASGVLNGPEIVAYAVALADAVGAVLDAGDVPLVLGGDCSVLLGGALALRRRDGCGLLFLDGHADFYQPSAEPSGEAASMDLALVTGHGPPAVGDIEGRAPLVRAQDAVVVGFRDAEEQARDGSQPLPGALPAFDLGTVRAAGAKAVAERAVAHLTRQALPTASGSTSTPTCSTTRSCPRSTTASPAGFRPTSSQRSSPPRWPRAASPASR